MTNGVNMFVLVGIQQLFIAFKYTYVLDSFSPGICSLKPQMFDFQIPNARNGMESFGIKHILLLFHYNKSADPSHSFRILFLIHLHSN